MYIYPNWGAHSVDCEQGIMGKESVLVTFCYYPQAVGIA